MVFKMHGHCAACPGFLSVYDRHHDEERTIGIATEADGTIACQCSASNNVGGPNILLTIPIAVWHQRDGTGFEPAVARRGRGVMSGGFFSGYRSVF
jgi:hypothetical protein